MKKVNLFLSAGVLLTCISDVCAQDWPQYLGPNKNSTSPHKGILRTWPAGGPEVLWTVNAGSGFGGSVIKDDKVYLLDRDDKTGDIMRCFDFKTGKEIWKFGYEGGFVSPSIAKINGEDQIIMVTASSGRGGFGDGTFQWQTSAQESKPVILC